MRFGVDEATIAVPFFAARIANGVQPSDYKLQGSHKLRLTFDVEAVEERMRIIAEILDKLAA